MKEQVLQTVLNNTTGATIVDILAVHYLIAAADDFFPVEILVAEDQEPVMDKLRFETQVTPNIPLSRFFNHPEVVIEQIKERLTIYKSICEDRGNKIIAGSLRAIPAIDNYDIALNLVIAIQED